MAVAPMSDRARGKPRSRRSGPDAPRTLYASKKITVRAPTSGSVRVKVSLEAPPEEVEKWREAGKAPAPSGRAGRDKAGDTDVRGAMQEALVSLFSDRFSNELDEVVSAYRLMIRESLAKGDDPDLQAALNRARLQERILASTSMVEQAQACQLLGLSTANPSATMRRKEERGELLRFSLEGRAVYPLFQFDIEERRIFPAMARLIALKPQTWSDFRLLHWLTRPHLDFDATPAERLGTEEAEVIAAFKREIMSPEHG